MIDPWNATHAEIRAWAHAADAMWPTQDWDLAVTGDETSILILELAMDPACPKRNFFLGCLYLLVGDAVRSGFVAHSRDIVLELLAHVPSNGPADVAWWTERSRRLLNGPPDAVDYQLWCDGGLRARSGALAGEVIDVDGILLSQAVDPPDSLLLAASRPGAAG